MSLFITFLRPTVIFLSIFIISSTQQRAFGKSSLTKLGDDLQIILPSVALTTGLLTDSDKKNTELYYLDFIKSFSTGFFLVHGLKYSFDKTRPDGSNSQSFPSAHTFAAFSGAAYINSRYGYTYGIPAYLAASVVGYSRIKANSHFLDDVLAGASIASLLNIYFTDLKKPGSNLNIGHDGDQYKINIATKFDEEKILNPIRTKYRFSLFFGPTYLLESEFSFKNNDLFDLFELNIAENHQYTANLAFDINFKKYGHLTLALQPYEINILDTLYKQIDIGDSTFNSGENVSINWQQYDLDSEYLYKIKNKSSYHLQMGGGLYLHQTRLNIVSNDFNKSFKTTNYGIIPYLTFSLGKQIFNRMFARAALSGSKLGDLIYFKARVCFDYQIDNKWTASLTGQHFFRQIEIYENGKPEDTLNESTYTLANFGIRYSF